MIRKSHFFAAATCAAVIGTGTLAFAQVTPQELARPETKGNTGATMVPETVPATTSPSTAGRSYNNTSGANTTGTSGMSNTTGMSSSSTTTQPSTDDTAVPAARADRN